MSSCVWGDLNTSCPLQPGGEKLRVWCQGHTLGVHVPLVLLTLLGLRSLLCEMRVCPDVTFGSYLRFECSRTLKCAQCPETTGNPAHGADPRCNQPQAWAQSPIAWGGRDWPSVPTTAARLLWSSVLPRASSALSCYFSDDKGWVR